ncbi:hypothetical protein PIIN_09845 [Serendipita indica DSM 11827]|uniref:NADH dehydrogenase [ubiquinone] 1 beta subcomplex subunit 11, mitochondrial n=1 Tax=Serendipita indica (strain DSM 11827) TaxID=1109443 RepID=G4U2L1_SERID|nr:hypothetical protein PIIN_09845 [Serendipita indica DSM 11827]
MASARTGLLRAIKHRTIPINSHSTVSAVALGGRRYASQGEHFNEPSGLLFSELPQKDGSKRPREDWELIWHIGMGGSIVLATAIFYFRPDTSISNWALEEAKARLEARGDSARYIPSADSRIQR